MIRYTENNPQGGYSVGAEISEQDIIDRLAALENLKTFFSIHGVQ